MLFLVVSLSYAEGTAALPETGGAATFVRRASNDLAGFMTGWALFLDYLIVIALSALFLPHYLAGALGIDALDRNPWDVVVAVVGDRRHRSDPSSSGVRRCTALGIVVPALDLLTQLLLVVLGFVARLLAARAGARHVARHASDLARARVRPAARDARVHRPRDRGEPRRARHGGLASTCHARCSAASRRS